MSEAVDTSQVAGRRELLFESLAEALADAERLDDGPWHQLGNWSLGQITKHLAISLNNTVDDVEFRAPWFVRLLRPLFKQSFIHKPMRPGFTMPDAMRPLFMPPVEVDTAAGLEAFRHAVARFQTAPSLPARSGTLGKMSRADWTQFHCRHAEMHLSFIVPGE